MKENIFLWKLWYVMVCHTVYTSVHTPLHANVHCNNSFVKFKAFCFCYTINTGSSSRFLPVILFFPCVVTSCSFVSSSLASSGTPEIHRLGRYRGGSNQHLGSRTEWQQSWSGSQDYCIHTKRASSPALPGQITQCKSFQRAAQLSATHALGASKPASLPPGSELPRRNSNHSLLSAAADLQQGQLS